MVGCGKPIAMDRTGGPDRDAEEERKRDVPSGSVLGPGHFTISRFYECPERRQKACFLGVLDGARRGDRCDS